MVVDIGHFQRLCAIQTLKSLCTVVHPIFNDEGKNLFVPYLFPDLFVPYSLKKQPVVQYPPL